MITTNPTLEIEELSPQTVIPIDQPASTPHKLLLQLKKSPKKTTLFPPTKYSIPRYHTSPNSSKKKQYSIFSLQVLEFKRANREQNKP